MIPATIGPHRPLHQSTDRTWRKAVATGCMALALIACDQQRKSLADLISPPAQKQGATVQVQVTSERPPAPSETKAGNANAAVELKPDGIAVHAGDISVKVDK